MATVQVLVESRNQHEPDYQVDRSFTINLTAKLGLFQECQKALGYCTGSFHYGWLFQRRVDDEIIYSRVSFSGDIKPKYYWRLTNAK